MTYVVSFRSYTGAGAFEAYFKKRARAEECFGAAIKALASHSPVGEEFPIVAFSVVDDYGIQHGCNLVNYHFLMSDLSCLMRVSHEVDHETKALKDSFGASPGFHMPGAGK